MGDFHGVSEKFSVSMLSEEGHGSERIRYEQISSTISTSATHCGIQVLEGP